MEHHICESCNGASDLPGTCSTEGCIAKGQDLVVCNCDGGVDSHNQAAAEAAAMSEEEESGE